MTHCTEATFEMVTPMFLGDAVPKTLAETIRPPSVKGHCVFGKEPYNGNEFVEKIRMIST